MAKTTTARKPRAAKKPATAKAPADKAVETTTAPAEVAAADNEIPAASGAEAKPEAAAAADGGAEAKVPEGARNLGAAGAVDPAGTAGAPAAQAEETREQAEAAPTDRKGAAEEGTQPGATALPPVAGPDPVSFEVPGPFVAFVVTGPKKGFRRGGMAFGPDPIELTPSDFQASEGESEIAAAERLLAILSERKLRCTVLLEDGSQAPIVPELIEQLRAGLDAAAADA